MKAVMIKIYVILWVALFSVNAYAWPWDKPTFNDDAAAVHSMGVSNNVWAVDNKEVFDRFVKQAGWKVEYYSAYRDKDGIIREFPCTLDGFNNRMRFEQSGNVLEDVEVWKVKGKILYLTKSQTKDLFMSIAYDSSVKTIDFRPVIICRRVK